MITLTKSEQFNSDDETVLSLGKFDGIHLGHELLLDTMFSNANGRKTAVFTFDSNPKSVTGKEDIKLLLTDEEKIKAFEERHLDYLLICPFSNEIMKMEPEEFIMWIVISMKVKLFVVGEDCAFGYKARGNAELLEKLSGEFGYKVIVVKKLKYMKRDISSTFLREVITEGNVGEAEKLLGHPYYLEGVVEHGNAIGRTIDFPTVNLYVQSKKLIPPYGVYATRVKVGDEFFIGITNIGVKPTIVNTDGRENPVSVETHILNFNRDLYDKEIRIYFCEFIRLERKFDTILLLQEQIKQDIVDCENFFEDK